MIYKTYGSYMKNIHANKCLVIMHFSCKALLTYNHSYSSNYKKKF